MIEYFQGKESIHLFDENMFSCLERKLKIPVLGFSSCDF
jgi:hypothetical protein